MPLQLASGQLDLLCLGAHPDDIEIGCGGTLLRLGKERDVSATFAVLTGTPDRRAEASTAAEAVLPGSKVTFADFGDGFLPESWGAVKRTLHDLAQTHPTPDLVFAPWPGDAHQDHKLLGELVPKVWRNSLVLHYEIPKWDGDVGRPTVYVGLSDSEARSKVAVLNSCYPSQATRDWWDDELFLGFMRVRGMECRHQYAEGFHVTKAELSW